MLRIDPVGARCFVYSFKDGLLSRLAHDLKLEVRTLKVLVADDGRLEGIRLDPRSIDVVCRMRDGREDAAPLDPADRQKILSNLRHDVLAVDRHPEIAVAITHTEPAGDGYHVRADLTLRGTTRSIETVTRRAGALQIAELTLSQPDFGIPPFSAMLGALRVRGDVKVRFELPVAEVEEPGSSPT